MAVTLYSSSDASAPVLTGSAGSLLTVLDAVLVNGYGTKPAAGWTIAYTATNKRQYQMGAGGSGCQLYIDDAAPGAGGAREARITGFKTGTAIGAGTLQFPSYSQQARGIGACVVRKSNTADNVARVWTIIADEHTFYMFVETGDFTAPVISMGWAFGDFESYYENDEFNCILIGRTRENTQWMGDNSSTVWWDNSSIYDAFSGLSGAGCTGSMMWNAHAGHYICSNFTGMGSSIPVGKHSDSTRLGHYTATGQMGLACGGPAQGNNENTWTGCFPYPNACDQGLFTAPVWLHHNGMVRGYLRGLWSPCHDTPLSHKETYTGTGSLAGKSFIALSPQGCLNYRLAQSWYVRPAQVHVEYSDTWS